MTQRIRPSPSLSPGRRFIVSPQLPFRVPGDGPLKFRTVNNGPPPPLYPPQVLQRHTRSTNDLVRKPQLDAPRLRSPPQSRGRTVEGNSHPQVQRTATPLGLKARGISPAILTSPKLFSRDIARPNFCRARSPALSTEPRLAPQGVSPSLKAPLSGLETGPSPRQYRRPISEQPTNRSAAQAETQPERRSHPEAVTTNSIKPQKTGGAAYENQMNVLRSSLMTHIASVQKEISRLQTERQKAHSHFQQFQLDPQQREHGRTHDTPSALSRCSTVRNERETHVSHVTTPSCAISRDEDIRSCASDSRGKDIKKVGANSIARSLPVLDAPFTRALSVGLDNRASSARACQLNGFGPKPQSGGFSARLESSSRNGLCHNLLPLQPSGAKSRINSLDARTLPRQSPAFGFDSRVALRSPDSGRIRAECSSRSFAPQPKFRPVQTSASRIQRAWRLSKWRRNFISYGEKLGWVGTLDWLQKHNQLYGTELAEPIDIRAWEEARLDAPLDAEVDPWGAEKLQEHLHRMWFGEPPPESQRRAHSEARDAAMQALPRRERSVGALGIGLAMPFWRRSPSLGTRRLSEVQLSQVSPTTLPGGKFLGMQRSPEVKSRAYSADTTADATSQSARLLNNYMLSSSQRSPLLGSAFPRHR